MLALSALEGLIMGSLALLEVVLEEELSEVGSLERIELGAFVREVESGARVDVSVFEGLLAPDKDIDPVVTDTRPPSCDIDI